MSENMRIVNYLLCAICAVTLLSACEFDEHTFKPEPPADSQSYVGLLTVDQNDGTFFEKENVDVEIELNDDGTMDIIMYKVKFASGMPIELNMTIPGVSYTVEGSAYSLSGDGIVPLALGGKFEKFTITALQGHLSADAMELMFNCGEYPVVYRSNK